jgi:hypothetical protein
LIGHNSSTENSYFYVLPKKIWKTLPKNNSYYLAINKKYQDGGGKTIKHRKLKTIRKYKKVLKYKSYKKSSHTNNKNTRKHKKKQYKKYSKRT